MKKNVFTLSSIMIFLLLNYLISFQAYCQPNIGLTATASHSGGGSGTYGPANYNDGVICGGGTCFGWVSTAANPDPAAWIEYDWTSAQIFNKITIYLNSTSTRSLCGANVQWWNASTSAWVTCYTYLYVSPPGMSYSLNFPAVTSTKMRLQNLTTVGSQASNPATEEIQVFCTSVPGLDVAMTSIDSPVVAKVGNNNIVVTYTNQRNDTVRWVYLGYSFDGVPVSNVKYVKKLSGSQSAQFIFPSPVFMTVGTHQLKAWVTMPNDSFPDNNRANDTMTRTLCTGMSGSYTIGPTGNYTSFGAAVTALTTCGIAGTIIFNVQPATYNERVVLPNIPGMGPNIRVIFRGASRTSTILSYTGTSTNYSTLDFNGASYFRFENMRIENLGATYCRAIFFTGLASYNCISNCNISVNNTYTSPYTTAIEAGSNESTYSTTGNNAFYDTIQNCDISGGYYGILYYGSSQTAVSLGNVIFGNTFHDQYYSSIYLYNMGNTKIQRNTIDIGGAPRYYTSSYGIYTNYCTHGIYDGNIIRPGQYGIYNYYENYYFQTDSSVYINNMIYAFNDPNYQTGIYSYYYCYGQKIYHNDIWVKGKVLNSYSYAALYLYYSYNTRIQNNIFVSNDTTLLLSFYPYPYGIPDLVDYNLYYFPAGTNQVFYNNSLYYSSLTAWKTSTQGLTTGHDAHSFENINPKFVSSNDLHLQPVWTSLKGPALWVPWDVDGQPRCMYQATLGADENTLGGTPPVAGFTSQDTVCMGTPVAFINMASPGDPKGHKWYVNKVFQGKTLNISYTFYSYGQDTVMLITDNCYGVDTFIKIITVAGAAQKPHADFVADHNVAEIYEFINFSDLSSNCPSRWKWKIYPDSVFVPGFGWDATYEYKPGTFDTSENPSVWFLYSGKYQVCFRASNSFGKDSMCKQNYIYINATANMCIGTPEINTLQGTVTDDDPNPINYFGPAAQSTCYVFINTCGDSVIFTLSYFDVKNLDYLRIYQGSANTGIPLWDRVKFPNGIGNGRKLSDVGFQSVFKSGSGQMYIEWFRHAQGTGTNIPGGFIGRWNTIVINAQPPVASFICPDTVCMNVPIYFQNTSKGRGNSYAWRFDLYNSSTDSFPTYTYTGAGWQAVTLQASNCVGNSSYTKNIYVKQPKIAPKPGFYADILYPVAGYDIVSLYDTSQGCSESYKWTITPNTFTNMYGYPTNANPKVRFDSTGCYTIKLKAGYNGFWDSVTRVCYIRAIKYCIPVVYNVNSDVGIGRVMLGTIDNSSTVGVNPYTDYSNSSSTYLDIRGTYNLTINRNSTFNSMNRKVWIDYNIDGVFSDPGELIGYEPSAQSLSWTTTFTVPAGAKPGATRMRIGTSLSNMPNTPCGPVLYGEYEDYRVILRPDGTPPVITVKGKSPVYLTRCTPSYYDSGATAWDNINGNITSMIKTTNSLNLNKAGTYLYKYNVMDSSGNKAIERSRTIIVTEDTVRPQLTLKGSPTMTLDVDSVWIEPGFNDTDACSGIKIVKISGAVNTHVVGTYVITYTAFDSAGNQTSKTRTVKVVDRIPPQLTLRGSNKIQVEVFYPLIDPGVTMWDNYDKNLALIITGTVNTSVVGTYTITYSLTDSSGNGPVILTREVDVIDTIAPVISSTQYKYGDTITIEVFDYFTPPVLTVKDNYYTTFTNSISGTYITNFPNKKATALGLYTWLERYTDGKNNYSEFKFNIKVVDKVKPVITMVGAQIVTICRFQTMTASDDSAFVTDNYYNNVVIMRSGTYMTDYLVNRNFGYYAMHYNAIDGSGNKADEVIRYVNVIDCGLSVPQSTNDKNLKIYPNPNAGRFVLEIGLTSPQDVKITITNSMGQLVKVITKTSSGEKINVDLSGYSSGIYSVKVQTDKETVVRQVTVTR